MENKRVRLQKLIDIFQNQADSFILHNKVIHDLPTSHLKDYDDYDHIDDTDEFGNPSMKPRFSKPSPGEGVNAEDISILLPSTLGIGWCVEHDAISLAIKESKLRFAQANESIDRIRLVLGYKSVLFRTLVRNARTQITKTRAWTAVHNADTTVHQHAWNYCMARDAYLKVQDGSGECEDLPELKPADLRISTAILGAAQVGQRNKQLPWIWSFGTDDTTDEWTNECMSLIVPDHN